MVNLYRDYPDPYKKISDLSTKLVSIIFLFDKNNRILMQLRDNNPNISCPNMWGPVGGHCKTGESPYDCCIRELEEETGYKETKINWFKNYLIQYNKEYNNEEHLVSIFWANYKNNQKIMCNEGQEMRFVNFSELKNLDTLEHNISWISLILQTKTI